MIESYAVFEGGGVKGVAFAGALKAAEEHNIKFIGYGGASVGAIIAFLVAIGFTSDEIKEKMSEFNFLKLLDGPVDGEAFRVKNFLGCIDFKSVFNSLKSMSKCKIFIYLVKIYLKNVESRKLIFGLFKRIISNRGAYKQRNILSLLSYFAYEKYPDILEMDPDTEEFTLSFSQFYILTKVDFRVIATDVNSGKAVEFSKDITPDFCVFRAISASSSYPLVFEPTDFKSLSLVDGGLSCNLPTYLFHKEIHRKLPIYAFDLISEKSPPITTEGGTIGHHIKGLVGAALDATTNILSQVVGGIAVPVRVPSDIGTFDFELTQYDIDRLYQSGYQSAKEFFSSHRLTRLATKVSNNSDAAILLYGNNFNFLLNLLIDSLPNESCSVKAWLYTKVNSHDNEILSFAKESNNEEEPNDHQFDLSNGSKDCVTSWNNKDVVWSYDVQHNKTRICFPITSLDLIAIDDEVHTERSELLALLCLSIDVHYEACNWLERKNYVSNNESGFDIQEDIRTIIHQFCYTIRNCMLGNQVSFHEFKGVRDA